jgi:hypothetical protein
MIAWWKLDEEQGSDAVDSSGNNLAGVLIGNPQWQPAGGKFGGGLYFDGQDDYVETNYSGNLPVWTVSAWIKGDNEPASQGPGGPVHWDKNLQINWDHQEDNFRGAAGTMVQDIWYGASFGDLQANTWYHLVATYDGENLKAYKNGVLITNTTTTLGGSSGESNTLKLGRHSTFADATNYFRGSIDDVRLYNYALLADEISAIYAGKDLLTEDQPKVLATSTEMKTSISVVVILTVGVIVTVVCAAVLILISIRRGKTTS